MFLFQSKIEMVGKTMAGVSTTKTKEDIVFPRRRGGGGLSGHERNRKRLDQ